MNKFTGDKISDKSKDYKYLYQKYKKKYLLIKDKNINGGTNIKKYEYSDNNPEITADSIMKYVTDSNSSKYGVNEKNESRKHATQFYQNFFSSNLEKKENIDKLNKILKEKGLNLVIYEQ